MNDLSVEELSPLLINYNRFLDRLVSSTDRAQSEELVFEAMDWQSDQQFAYPQQTEIKDRLSELLLDHAKRAFNEIDALVGEPAEPDWLAELSKKSEELDKHVSVLELLKTESASLLGKAEGVTTWSAVYQKQVIYIIDYLEAESVAVVENNKPDDHELLNYEILNKARAILERYEKLGI